MIVLGLIDAHLVVFVDLYACVASVCYRLACHYANYNADLFALDALDSLSLVGSVQWRHY